MVVTAAIKIATRMAAADIQRDETKTWGGIKIGRRFLNKFNIELYHVTQKYHT